MATYLGQSGSAKYNSISIGELRSWSLDGVSLETVDDTVKGDTVRTHKGALGESGTATLVCYLDYVTGQQDVIDFINAGTGTAMDLELTADTNKKFTVSAICQSYSFNSPEGSAVDEITLTFKCTGSVTPSWS